MEEALAAAASVEVASEAEALAVELAAIGAAAEGSFSLDRADPGVGSGLPGVPTEPPRTPKLALLKRRRPPKRGRTPSQPW